MPNSQGISRLLKLLKQMKVATAALYVLLGCVLFATLMSNVKPDEVDVKLLSIAKNTIHSPITIEDKVTTEKKKREAAQRVEDQYTYRGEYKQNRVDIVNSVFDAVQEVQEEAKNMQPAEGESPKQLSISEQLDMLKKKLPNDLTKSLSDTVLLELLNATPEQLVVARESTVTAVNNIMSTNIKINEIDEFKQQIQNELSYANVNGDVKDAIIVLGKYAIVANYFYDPAATKERKQMEMDSIEPVYILQGQILVKEGDTITREVYEQLKLVGLLDDGNSLQPFIGLFILVVLLVYFVQHQFDTFLKRTTESKPYLLAYVLIISLVIVIMKTISFFQTIEFTGLGFLVPVAMGTMLVKLMIGDRFVFITSMIFSICGSIIFNEGVTSLNYTVAIYFLMSSWSVSVFLREKQKRSMILRAGILVSVLNVAVLSAILLIRNANFSPVEIAVYLLMAAASGIVASVLTLGLLPYLESGLGIVSSMKLMELASPNHPLLRKILLEAPGTYHHSIMVANLSEAACEAVGANGLLARVGAYYHDIGKTLRPHFFIENQMGMQNPHDSLTPELSRDIIISHVSEGVKLLERHKIPKELVDIAAQHHGTTLLKYFYYKAVQQNENEYTEEMFRYPGPKASSKEAAIVGIADSVEAAVRSLNEPTPERIEQLVAGIIKDRLQDGQFSNCDLTFRDLELIKKTLCETLNGIFHSRIQYPEMKKEQVKL